MSCCWCFTFCFGILHGHVPDQVHNEARVVPFVVVPHTAFAKVVSSLMRVSGIKVKEMGSVSKSVETNASSA